MHQTTLRHRGAPGPAATPILGKTKTLAQLAGGAALDQRPIEAMIEEGLNCILPSVETHPQPLHRAMRYAVFSGGKRIRPQLLLYVAAACGASHAEVDLALRAACAVELVHSSSLVHDDLPYFDDAQERRGQPTVHVLYGKATAVLVGDALLALAFEALADAPLVLASSTMKIIRLLGQAVGSVSGLTGGQSMEQMDETRKGEFPRELIERYHAMKTGALFRAAAEAGAVTANRADAAAWAQVGSLLGAWYQLADDLLDVRGSHEMTGKQERDADLQRPNAVLCCGEREVMARMQGLLDEVRRLVSVLTVGTGPLMEMIDRLNHHIFVGIGVPA